MKSINDSISISISFIGTENDDNVFYLSQIKQFLDSMWNSLFMYEKQKIELINSMKTLILRSFFSILVRPWSRIFSHAVEIVMHDGFDLLELLLPFLFDFDKFFFHQDLKLVFHLVNTSLQFEDLLLHAILPSKLIHGGFFPVVFDHGKDLILEFLDFAHHFLLPVVVNFPPLGNEVPYVVLVAWKPAVVLPRITRFRLLCFHVIRNVSVLYWCALTGGLLFALHDQLGGKLVLVTVGAQAQGSLHYVPRWALLSTGLVLKLDVVGVHLLPCEYLSESRII